MLKILKISVLLILIIGLTATTVSASDISSIIQAGQDFLKIGDAEGATINDTQLKKVNSNIFNIFFAVGIIAAVVVGIVLGIQFMTAGIEGQAKIKEAVVPYLVGCVIIFGAFGIWKIVVKIGENTEKEIYTAENGEEMAKRYINSINGNEYTNGDVFDEVMRAKRSMEKSEGKNKGIYDFYRAYYNYLHNKLYWSVSEYVPETTNVFYILDEWEANREESLELKDERFKN